MRLSFKASLVTLAAIGSLAAAAPAWAGCADTAMKPASWRKDGADGQLIRVNLGAQGVVGLWSVSLVAGGSQVDWGYSEWHSDGTEIMNSGGHTPASGNFCLGVWRQSGPNTYHLKHFALGYNPANGQLAVKVILTEDVTIDGTGATFTGPFTLDAYDPSGATLLQHQAGTITGHRVLPN
jgi:hypothetical protein